MANVRDLSRKINSLKSMQKVMGAMNMIATTKFKKFSKVQEGLVFFNQKLDSLLVNISASCKESDHPCIKGHGYHKRSHIVLFSADRGMCGSHNSSVNRALAELVDTKNKNSIESEISAVGLKGANYCTKQNYDLKFIGEISEKSFDEKSFYELADRLYAGFVKGDFQELFIVYNEFVSTLSQVTRVVKVFPFVESPALASSDAKVSAIDCEPSDERFAAASARALLNYRLKAALFNSYLSEHASRMTAMENAANNSEDLIYRYNKLRNRARQTTITNELIEIVAGKEAMK